MPQHQSQERLPETIAVWLPKSLTLGTLKRAGDARSESDGDRERERLRLLASFSLRVVTLSSSVHSIRHATGI